jgi:hypothetical protein
MQRRLKIALFKRFKRTRFTYFESPNFWKDARGRVWRIEDMETEHIKNCLYMFALRSNEVRNILSRDWYVSTNLTVLRFILFGFPRRYFTHYASCSPVAAAMREELAWRKLFGVLEK